MRSGADIRGSRITTIACSSAVTVFGCASIGWCDVAVGYGRGWAWDLSPSGAAPVADASYGVRIMIT